MASSFEVDVLDLKSIEAIPAEAFVGKLVFNPPWVRMVFSVYSMEADQIAGMKKRMYDGYVQTYQRTIRAQIQGMGCKPGRIKLEDPLVLRRLDDEAERWATGVAGTYNKNLSGAISSKLSEFREKRGTLFGLNRYILSNLVRPWVRNYWRGKRTSSGWQMGKLQSIAVTEETRAHMFAVKDFYNRSTTPRTLARVSPRMAVCEECKDLVRLGWLPIEELMSVILPVHPNCVLPGQMILTTEGLVAIEDVAVGTEVVTPEDPALVSQAFERHYTGRVYRLEVDGRVLRLTADHPVLTRSGWRPVQELLVGEEILVMVGASSSTNFEWSRIGSLEMMEYDGPVYNLQVGGPECYVAEGIVVHNCPHELETRRDRRYRVQCDKLWRGGRVDV
jgi:hypothetical protein